MYLTSLYVQANHQLPKLFDKIRSAKTPEKFSVKILKEWGFSSSAHLAFIPLLKELGFLTTDGIPTTRYLEFQETPESSSVLGEALRDAYMEIFIMSANPQDLDYSIVQTRFQQVHNGTVREAKLMAETFFELLRISNPVPMEAPQTASRRSGSGSKGLKQADRLEEKKEALKEQLKAFSSSIPVPIQIHLPDTRDIEVFDAIFKSLKKHFTK